MSEYMGVTVQLEVLYNIGRSQTEQNEMLQLRSLGFTIARYF